jgi:hypothetical protein
MRVERPTVEPAETFAVSLVPSWNTQQPAKPAARWATAVSYALI